MTEEALVEWLTSLAPILSPLFGMTGVLGGGWLVYRQSNRKTDSEAEIAEAGTFVTSVQTVTAGFTQLLEQQRAANAQTLERVTTLETKQGELERKVEVLQEEQRQWRRWKAAAVEYIHQLRRLVAQLGHSAPAAPREIADDIGDGPAA
jgi:chromosome segregation ATPase